MPISKDFEKYTVHYKAELSEVLHKQDKFKVKTIMVISDDNKILGTISDGDLRRYTLTHGIAPNTLEDVMRGDFFRVYEGENVERRILAFDLSKGAIPIVGEDMTLIDIYDGEYSFNKSKKHIIKSFTSIAPARISFAGGGSDVSDWFRHSTGKCINAAIDIFARVNFDVRDDEIFRIKSINTGFDKTFSKAKLFDEPKQDLVLNCLRKFPELPGLNVTIYCDFPPGSGLGGSSSLCVAMLNGCAKLSGKHLTNADLQSLAYEVERFDTKILGGWQDQIAAVSGGLISSTFHATGIKSTKIHLNEEEQEALNSCLFLFQVGEQRSSSAVHKNMNKQRKSNGFQIAMAEILEIADEVEDTILARDFTSLGKFLDKGWQAKRRLGDFISNDDVDHLYDVLIKFGASGGRLLGAGGSGFLMMFVELKMQGEFVRQCAENKLEFRRFKIDMLGSRLIGEQA